MTEEHKIKDSHNIETTEISAKSENQDLDHNKQENNKEKQENSKNLEESNKLAKQEKQQEESPKDNEPAFDFVALKNKFKKSFAKKDKSEKKVISSEHKAEEKEEKEEPVSFDLKKSISYTKKNAKWLLPLVLIILVVGVSFYFRLMPSSLPITDDWAENSIQNSLRTQIVNQVNQQYPNLPEQNRNSIINRELANVMEQNGDQLKQQQEALSQQFKAEFKDDNGDTYLIAIDPYLWLSQARNVINHGHLGDKLIDGKPHFSLRDGRLDKQSSVQLHPYVGAYFYKVMSIFSNISLMHAIFLLPAFLIALAAVPAFFIGKRLAGNIGGFFAALFLVINKPLLGRTAAGFADTDPYNALFPLLIVWMMVESYYAKDLKKSLIYSAAGGLFVGLYATTWSGWPHIFLLTLAAFISMPIFALLKYLHKHSWKINSLVAKDSEKNLNFNWKQPLAALVVFFVSSGIFVSWLQSFISFKLSFLRPAQFSQIKEVGVKSVWPNVLTTVAEFNTVSFSSIISQVGGLFLFFLALMGIVLLLSKTKSESKKISNLNNGFMILSAIYYLVALSLRDNLNNPLTFIVVLAIPVLIGVIKVIYLKQDNDLAIPVFLAVWLFATSFAFSQGIRFALLVAAPFALVLGSSLGLIFKQAGKWLHQAVKLNKSVSYLAVFAVLMMLTITPLTEANSIAKNEIPSMNDAWYNSLTKIKEDTSDSIITSWWDFGHWFVAVAERRVTFDGGDQGERIHWVGKSLISPNEDEAVGILRMLNCRQEEAPHVLDEFTGQTLKSIEILEQVLPIHGRVQAKAKYVELGLSSSQADTMLEYTHCENLLPNYYITSEDMVGKAGVWGHFGSWDFRKATMYQNVVDLDRAEGIAYLQNNFALSEADAIKTYTEIKTTAGDQWIAPWPGIPSTPQACSRVSETELDCQVSIQGNVLLAQIDLTTYEVKFAQNDGVVPNSLVYVDGDEVVEKKFEGSKTGFSLVLIPNGDEFRLLITDPLQAYGMFTRLFFLEGHGLDCFSKFDDVRQVTGGRIITWKVDYQCMQENIIY